MRHIQEHVLVDCDIRRTLYTVGSLIYLFIYKHHKRRDVIKNVNATKLWNGQLDVDLCYNSTLIVYYIILYLLFNLQ